MRDVAVDTGSCRSAIQQPGDLLCRWPLASPRVGYLPKLRALWGSHPRLDVQRSACLLRRLHRLIFVCAKPHNDNAFDALRAEAVQKRDLVILPHIWEHYNNITHQTFEATRAAALDPDMTHLLKVQRMLREDYSPAFCSLWGLLLGLVAPHV